MRPRPALRLKPAGRRSAGRGAAVPATPAARRARRDAARLLDANANRALEGLRVTEELLRFLWRRPVLWRRCRSLRHEIAAAIESFGIPIEERLRARNSLRDPGRRVSGGRVGTPERVLLINFQRVKEALRVLEECARVVAPRRTAALQRLRFRVYDAERLILLRVAALRHH
ncbi:MAG TPA: hypothetical protein VGB20_03640 [bacterium]